MNEDRSASDTTYELYSVNDAARVLNISPEAVRSRLHRGSLERVKMDDGSVMARLNADDAHQNDDRTHDRTGDDSEVNAVLRDQVTFLRRELERKDAILMTMAQRIPELEASQMPPEARVTPSEGRERDTPQEETKPSWWRRFLGVE
jgi:hypothetical protein